MRSFAALPLLAVVSSPTFAANLCGIALPNLPTLDEVGLVGLILVVGIAGGALVRYKKKQKGD